MNATATPAIQVEDILPPGYPPLPLWAWILMGAAALAVFAFLGWLLYKALTKKKNLPPVSPEKEFSDTLASLEARADSLPAPEFASLLSRALRSYLARTQPALRTSLTTEELLAKTPSTTLPETACACLPQFLQSCDLLKFAPRQELDIRRSNLLAQAKTFLPEATP